MANFEATQQEIQNVINPEENSVVIVDPTIPTQKASVDSSGNLSAIVNIDQSNISATISPGNSTSTPLGSNATFTGSWESTLGAATITMVVFADQDSATDGLVVEWSSDGVNVDEDDKFSIFTNKGKQFSFGPPSHYFRVKYTNGSVAQSTFRLQCILRPFRTKPSSHRLIDNLNDNDDAELIKAIIAAKDPSGIYINLSADDTGKLNVVTSQTVPPSTATPVTIAADTPLSVSTTSTTDYTITNGKTFRVLALTYGAEGDPNTKGSKVTVSYVDASSVEHVISRVYFEGFTGQILPDTDKARDGTTLTGNGTTTKIRVVRTRLGGSALEIDAVVRGYES